MRRAKVNLTLIRDETSRRASFKKRKAGFLKKLNELVTLCDVKACAAISSEYDSQPEFWSSKESVEEVVSKVMELPMLGRSKKMMDQKAYLLHRITKEQEQVKKLHDWNRDFQIREFMFDCLRGIMMEYNYDEDSIRALRGFMARFLNFLDRRVEILTPNGQSSFIPLLPDNGLSLSFSPLRENGQSSSIPPLTENGQSSPFPPLMEKGQSSFHLYGESNQSYFPLPENSQSSSFPPLTVNGQSFSIPPLMEKGKSSSFSSLPDNFSGQSSSFPSTVGVVEANPHDVADVAPLTDAVVAAPFGVFDHIQYQNTNMNHNQQGPVKYEAADGFCDQIQHRTHNMNLNHNQYQPVHYQAPVSLYDQIQQYGIHDMKPNQNMHHNQYERVYYQDPVWSHDQIQHGSHNMKPNQQSFTDPLMGHPQQQMGYVGENANTPFMDGNYYYYHQPPTVPLATTSHMSSITTAPPLMILLLTSTIIVNHKKGIIVVW